MDLRLAIPRLINRSPLKSETKLLSTPMVQQKCQHKMARSNNKMSIQERINELLEAPDIKSLIADWQQSFIKLGSTPHERLEGVLSMDISQMSRYSDPVVRFICKDPEYLSTEDQEMDRILLWRPTFLVLDNTLNAATLAKYAWLYESWEDPDQKAKAKQTLDHVTNLGYRYISDMLRVSQKPYETSTPKILQPLYYTRINDDDEHKSVQPEELPDQFIRMDLDAVRQSVYDLIDQYPRRVLFLEYLVASNVVDNMTASQYKNQYQYYQEQYPNPRVYIKTIEHKGVRYNLKIETFQGSFRGIETLAMAFGYAISGLNLITIHPQKP